MSDVPRDPSKMLQEVKALRARVRQLEALRDVQPDLMDMLRESQRTLSTLMSNLPGMAYRCRNDRDWTMEFVSEGCLELTGYAPSALVQNGTIAYARLIHPEDQESVWRGVQEGIRQREPFRLAYRIHTATGDEKWVWEQGRAVFGPSDELLALEGFITDITEQKRNEEARRRAHADLDDQVRQRTADLLETNAKLQREATERLRAEQALEERARLASLGAEVGVVMTSGRSLAAMLQECSSIMVRNLDAAFARIWTLHPTENMLELQASAGQYTHLDGPHCRVPVGQLKIGRIARDRKPHLTNQVLGDPEIGDQEWARREGMISFAGYPLVVDDRLVGVMAMFARQPLSEATLHTLAAMADGIAVGIQNKLVEAEARENQRRLQSIIDNTTAVVFLKDSEFRYLLTNRRFEELFHCSRERIIGKTDFDIFPAPIADAFRANDRLVVESGRPISVEEVAPHDEGPRNYISVKFPMYRADGSIFGVCGIATEITEVKRVQEQLRVAKEAAEAANQAKSRFLANISHEIRTPIVAILGATEQLPRAESKEDREHRIDMILRNGRHLLSLIDDLLDLSRLEAEKLEVHPAPCSLPDVLADVLAVATPLRSNAGVDLCVHWETPIPRSIRTDPTRFKQAIINLVSNSLKFTEAGKVDVRVRIDRDAPDPRLSVIVEDTGIGIRAADLQRIFEAFVQLDRTPLRPTGGVGLGLTITKWIAEQLGGDLGVESVEGQGSRFILRIATGPLDDISWISPHEASVSLTGASGDVTPAPYRCALRGAVLLAEDSPDVRDLLNFALTRAGAVVKLVENGREAVDAAVQQAFDLILMDIRMPVMDGLTAVAELRRHGCLTPIIALTASTTIADRDRILESGFDEFWPKPISIERLLDGAAAYLEAAQPDHVAPPRQEESSDPYLSDHPRFRAIRDEFLASLPQRMKTLRHALSNNQTGEAYNTLHQLVGTCGMYGYAELSHAAERVLQQVKQGSIAEARAALPDLEERVTFVLRTAPIHFETDK